MPRLLRLAALALPLLGGCSNDIVPFDPTVDSRLRVIHAAPTTPTFDLGLDAATAFRDLEYRGDTDYLFITAGQRTVTARSSDGTTTYLTATPTLAAGASNTLVITGLTGALETVLLADDTPAPPSGSFKIRMGHFAPNTPALDLYITDATADIDAETPDVAGLPFKSVSDYLALPATPGRIRVVDPSSGTKVVLVDTGTTPRNFFDGQISTLFVVEKPNGGAPFTGILLGDGD